MITTRPYRSAAFTLIEMIVVITVIMLIFGTLMSGLATMQKATDTLSTPAVIQAVHESCYRNARQFGSAALVYGFTLDFGDGAASPADTKTSSTVITSEKSAIAIVPWVIINGTTTYQGGVDIFTDIGRQPLWDTSVTPARIYFDDRLRPCRQVGTQVATTTPAAPTWQSMTANRYLHIAFEPRTGFVHVDVTNTSNPATAGLTAAAITAPASLPTQVTLELSSTTTYRLRNRMIISYTGVIDAHAKL